MTMRDFIRQFHATQPATLDTWREMSLETWIESSSMHYVGDDGHYMKVADTPSESNYSGIRILYCPNLIECRLNDPVIDLS